MGVDPEGLLVLFVSAGGAAGAGVGQNVNSNPISYISKNSGFYFGRSEQGGSAAGAFSSNGAGGIIGGAVGLGPTIGFSTGTTQELDGKSTTVTIQAGPISLAASFGGGNWGLSLSGGGKGFGLGASVEETQNNTIQTWQSDYGRKKY